MGLITATFLWACLSIVCPACTHKLLYYATTQIGFSRWYIWLSSEEKCPKCG